MSGQRGGHGEIIASLLGSAWRGSDFHPLEITSQQLAQAVPLLQYSGAAGLGWWRIRETHFRGDPSAARLRETYRFQALRSAIYEEKIQRIFRLFRQASIQGILAKGWGVARYYPDKALRPCGDIDLAVRAEDFAKANALLLSPELRDCDCDLHEGSFTDLADIDFDELWARSERPMIGSEPIAVLGREHHLRLLCLHLVRHSAWRPLWLCDVAVALETLPDNFDWDRCLSTDERRVRWIAYAIQLAHVLLGAKNEGIPETITSQRVAWWFKRWVLKQWANPAANPNPPRSLTPMLRLLRQRRGLWNDIRARWPDPIVATRELDVIPNALPRLPYQLAVVLPMAGRFLMRACIGNAKR